MAVAKDRTCGLFLFCVVAINALLHEWRGWMWVCWVLEKDVTVHKWLEYVARVSGRTRLCWRILEGVFVPVSLLHSYRLPVDDSNPHLTQASTYFLSSIYPHAPTPSRTLTPLSHTCPHEHNHPNLTHPRGEAAPMPTNKTTTNGSGNKSGWEKNISNAFLDRCIQRRFCFWIVNLFGEIESCCEYALV